MSKTEEQVAREIIDTAITGLFYVKLALARARVLEGMNFAQADDAFDLAIDSTNEIARLVKAIRDASYKYVGCRREAYSLTDMLTTEPEPKEVNIYA